MDVRLVSDRYIKEPLKARTRYVTKLVIQIRYCLLLLNPYSYIDTKHDLTVYLAEKSKIEFGEITKNASLHTMLPMKISWQNFLSNCRPMTTKKQTL